jgi:hypothetical protein
MKIYGNTGLVKMSLQPHRRPPQLKAENTMRGSTFMQSVLIAYLTGYESD